MEDSAHLILGVAANQRCELIHSIKVELRN